jgi:hypothetical protein
LKPLLDIFDKPPIAGSLRQIFILTDGEGALARRHSEYLGTSQSTLTLLAPCAQYPTPASALRPCGATPATRGSLPSALAREPVGYPTYRPSTRVSCVPDVCAASVWDSR